MVSPRIIDLLRSGQTSDSYIVRGWVRTKREGKGISFLELNDGSSLQGLQIVLSQDRKSVV